MVNVQNKQEKRGEAEDNVTYTPSLHTKEC